MSLNIGDTIRILVDGTCGASVVKGDILTIVKMSTRAANIIAKDLQGLEWSFAIHLLDKEFEPYGKVTGISSGYALHAANVGSSPHTSGHWLNPTAVPLSISKHKFKEGDFVTITTSPNEKRTILAIKDFGFDVEVMLNDNSNAWMSHLEAWIEPTPPPHNWSAICDDLWDKYTLD